ncbi:MAG: hypothetical protein AABX70_03055, partial [Nanoarchaeota archaeon]
MKKSILPMFFLVFLVLTLSVQAVSCDQAQQLTQALTDFITLGGSEAVKPFLQGITYTDLATQFETTPSLPFPPILCKLDIEKQLQQYINTETGEPLHYLAIQNKKHQPTYIDLRQGTVHPVNSKGEITYDLILSHQDLKPSLKDYPILELFKEFTVPDATHLTKKEGNLEMSFPLQTPIQLSGVDKLSIINLPPPSEKPLYTFGKDFIAFPLQSRPGYQIYALSFKEKGDWKYPGDLTVEQQSHEALLLTSPTEQELRKVPLQFIHVNGEVEELTSPLEIYPDFKSFEEEKKTEPLILITPDSLTVQHGKLELTNLEKNYDLQVEGTFHLFLSEGGIHLALEHGRLSLKPKNTDAELQLTQGSVYLYRDGSIKVIGMGKLHTIQADYTIHRGVTPNALQITPEKEGLLLTGSTPFSQTPDHSLITYETSLESNQVQLVLPLGASIRLTKEGYELGKGAELQYQLETASYYGYTGVHIHNKALVNYDLNHITLVHTYNQDGFDNGYAGLRKSYGEYTVLYDDSEIPWNNAPTDVTQLELQLYTGREELPELTEGNAIQIQGGSLRKARGIFIIKTDDQTYRSHSSTLEAEWQASTMPGAPPRFVFKNSKEEEDYLTLKIGSRTLIFSNHEKLRYRQETLTEDETPSTENGEPPTKQDEHSPPSFIIQAEDQEGNIKTIYLTKDQGLYTPQIDSLGSYDQEYFKNPNELYHPDYAEAEPGNLREAIHGDLLWGYPTKDWLRIHDGKIYLDIGPLYHLRQYYSHQYDRDLTLKSLLEDILNTLKKQSKEISGFGSDEQKQTQAGENLLHTI